MFTRNKPSIVGWGLDRIAFNIVVPEALDPIIWKQVREGSPHQVLGSRVEASGAWDRIAAFQRPAPFVLFNARKRTPGGSHVYGVVAGAETCARLGAARVLETISAIATELIGQEARVTASFIELYVDLQKTQRPGRKLLTRVTSRPRRCVVSDCIDVQTAEDETMLKVTWGRQGRCSDNIVGIYYEKALLDPDDWRVAKWRQSGAYVHGKTVRRLEFRVWGAAPLIQAGIDPGIDSLADGGLNALWGYLTTKWFRVLRGPAHPKKRVESHPWWSRIQALRPLGNAPLLPRDFEPDRDKDLEVPIKQAAGHLRSFAGLTDSDADRSLALTVTLDAAEELLRRAEGGDEAWDDWDGDPGEDLAP